MRWPWRAESFTPDILIRSSTKWILFSDLIRTLMMMKVTPGSKNSRKPERMQQAPPPRMPVTKANLTPMESRWLPMKGVTRKATRQLVPMIRP